MAKAVRGAKMPKAKGHAVGGKGKSLFNNHGTTAKRGAAAVSGPQVAKAAKG